MVLFCYFIKCTFLTRFVHFWHGLEGSWHSYIFPLASRNISDCSHFLILVSIRTALLTNIKFGEGWSQPSNETQNLVDRSWRPKNIIQYYYHAIWKWYIYTYICIKNVFEQYLYQYNESNIIFTYMQTSLNHYFVLIYIHIY